MYLFWACRSYNYHYDVQKPCCCEEENYDTYDFEVLEPKRKPKCSKVKLEAYADHPVRGKLAIILCACV